MTAPTRDAVRYQCLACERYLPANLIVRHVYEAHPALWRARYGARRPAVTP